MNVIVYGTLRRGERAHAFMNTATFEGNVTVDGYEMRHLGGFPGIAPNPQAAIVGELYSGVTPELLARLDQYEGYDGDHAGSLYLRVIVPQYEAYIYVYNGNAQRYSVIETGDWKRQKDISHHVQSLVG